MFYCCSKGYSTQLIRPTYNRYLTNPRDPYLIERSLAGRGDDAPPHWSTEERHHRDRPSHKYPADDHRDKWREGPPRGYRGDRVAAGRGRSRDRYERAPPPPPPRRRDSGERESYDHREGDRRGWERHHRRGEGEYERDSVERKRPRNYVSSRVFNFVHLLRKTFRIRLNYLYYNMQHRFRQMCLCHRFKSNSSVYNQALYVYI